MPERSADLDYDTLHADIRAFADERDWRKFHDPKSLLIAMMGEVGEVSELIQWLPSTEAAQLVRSEPLAGQMRAELADVFIYLIQLADACDVDLITSGAEKLAANARKYPAETVRGAAPERPGAQ
ncbi:MAG: nucleotide pyrophosphohydrolase [Nakamurella sp.]